MSSPTSSAVSVSSAPSVISDLSQCETTRSSEQTNLIVPEHNGRPFFESGDGDMELIVNGTRFETHRYLIKWFRKLTDMWLKLKINGICEIVSFGMAEDFKNMFQALYSSVIQDPLDFSTQVLLSAPPITKEYAHPELQSYALKQLETRPELESITRLELGSEDEALSEKETEVLGTAMFVRISIVREQELRRKAREVDGLKDEKAPTQKEKEAGPENVNEQSQPPEPHPSFAAVPSGGVYRPGEYTTIIAKPQQLLLLPAPCHIPACAAATFKNLRAQQVLHEKNIANLKVWLEKVKSGHAEEQVATPILEAHPSIQEEVCSMRKDFRFRASSA